ncbi:MAG TPA: cysteine desulfurase family protein [Chloroflexota bacterium]|nr:cysteine desulfurase family protein [Chloroflexota bacterium]
MSQEVVYLDYNATTPVDPSVVSAMLPYLAERFGNASSAHGYGYEAHDAMERARGQVAALIGAASDEIVFTGGGSESDNLALKGVVFSRLEERPHVVSTRIEHPAVLNTLAYLQQRFGVEVTLLPVDERGVVLSGSLKEALRPNTVLVSVMHANNETGTLQDIAAIGAVTRERGILFHVDAAQSAGKVPVDVAASGVDLLTLAGHKLYAPKGIGVLFVRRGVSLDPLIHGSSQERGRRAGTENVAAMVALGAACDLARDRLPQEGPRLARLRDRLHQHLLDQITGLHLNGHPKHRLPNTLNVSFPGVTGQAVLAATPAVAASTGAACHSGETSPSATLIAMGLPPDRAAGAVRLSIGRWTSEADIERAAGALTAGYRECAGVVSAGRTS